MKDDRLCVRSFDGFNDGEIRSQGFLLIFGFAVESVKGISHIGRTQGFSIVKLHIFLQDNRIAEQILGRGNAFC